MNNANGGNIIYKFLGDSSNLESTTKNVNNGFKGMTKSVFAANIATKAVSAGFNMIRNNAGRAIQRIDTFNAFPKVMKNFGVSTQEANNSIKRMDKAMRGLPTSLDQAVSGVQNLFMVTKDLPEAERIFKAINDSAMVFANGSTEAVDRFSYAFKQAMSSGKVSAQDFNQMNEAIPGLMDKVAESMGITYAELKHGLSEGDISMDQFNTTLKKLDTEGGAGMKALAQSAKTSTGGIATTITNAKTAVARGIAELFNSIDKGLKNAGLGGINEVVSNMGKALESGLKTIAPYITEFIIKMRDIYNWVKKNQEVIKPLAIVLLSLVGAFKLLTIIASLSTIISGFMTTIAPLLAFFRFLIGVVKGLMVVLKALWVVMMANPIFLIIAAIVALVAIFVVLWNKCEWFRNFWIGLWEKIKTAFVVVWTVIKTVFLTVVNYFRNQVKAFVSVATAIYNAFKNLPNKLLNIGKNIALGLWNGIKGMKDWVINKVKALGKSIIKGLKNVLGIHSPSTEFAMIGRFSVLGYTEALDNMQKDIQNKVQETFGLSPQLTGTMSNHYSPNVMVNNDINVSTDPLGQTVKKIKTFSGGAKNDYNYGMGV